MTTFIEDVLKDVTSKHQNFSEIVFILPSKRAGVFLKNYLRRNTSQTQFVPDILSIEEFVETLSALKQVSNIELLFQFYTVYKIVTPKANVEPFESFAKWAQIVLQDFNEIDRYLIPSEKIFDYLKAIKEIDHWSLDNEKTDVVKQYLHFWKLLKTYYSRFNETLLQNGLGYQGLIYKEATENIESYIANTDKTHIFLGFNALNTAEEVIIQELLQHGNTQIYWDIDQTFFNDQLHGAGYFTRSFEKGWSYFKNNPFHWTSSFYATSKHIEVIGCPKSVGQAKQVGQLLHELHTKNKNLNNTAVVLGEEELLMPILNSIPEGVKTLNVTMGLSLKSIPLAALFEQLFNIHKKSSSNFYFKDLLVILSNQMVAPLLKASQNIISTIQKNNLVFITFVDLKKLCSTEDLPIINLLFSGWNVSSEHALDNCTALILKIKQYLDIDKNNKRLELEYLYRLSTLFNEIKTLNSKYHYIDTVSSLHVIYKELLSSETLDFKGEPLDGLQIMGMLESRVLDFETVIITSVNEGILPSGKTNNSFIPYDVKRENKLPTYKEKDAVYTYHFYRLLQRAKHVYIIYNTEIDTLKGGEKSRFITQLDIEGIHKIKHSIVAPSVPKIEQQLKVIKKDEQVINALKVIAEKGFSPSSLTNYIRNPIDFYFEKVLGIKELDEVEETVAANTLGTVIHNTLEDFYKPLENQYLTIAHLSKMKSLIAQTVAHHFNDIYKKGDISTGKNLISFEIAKRYISNFLNTEEAALKAGNTIKILAIEDENHADIAIPELNFPVTLKGKIDRVDEFNGVTRIIDYKSGKVFQNNVEIIDWETITSDYKAFSKSFQILSYAYMMHLQKKIELPVEAGIISFKNLNEGFLKFGIKTSSHARIKHQLITQETLDNFEIQLKKLISEICDANIDFTEKLVE